ncbi:hypothetical protein GCM10029976_032460 [Kribbella albertanoniae]|uniref:Uncharacterized protein n=1 Tax=Kribbella albertanoniae TaxID=1266829 RepID=A0A4R4QJI6_9ACTN|nr:hypothetical protein [Kribbella albertanoniae]TDC35529.1 hypothetical protein E1261_01305 [Kribbella albertanoniae]
MTGDTAADRPSTVSGLSCFTSALRDYLAVEWAADELLARSIELTLVTDLVPGRLAFSHHRPSLDRLPDGSHLAYAAAADPEALTALAAAEVATYGRAIIPVDAAELPWSVHAGRSPAPHWLLIESCGPRSWQVNDSFSALLPHGHQLPYRGEVRVRDLRAALRPFSAWLPEHRLRIRFAFGAPVTPPADGPLWLRRSSEQPAKPAILPTGQLVLHPTDVLQCLRAHLMADCRAESGLLEDLWAAASHKSFAYRWYSAHDAGTNQAALAAAIRCWDNVPRVLRFAAESASRGRPRCDLVSTLFEQLERTEADVRGRR